MTNAEYNSEYAYLRRKVSELTISQRNRLLSVYEDAAKQAGEVLKLSLSRGISSLTTDRWKEIERQLIESASIIANTTDKLTKETLSKAYDMAAEIEKAYILSASESIGISITGLNSVYSGINNKLIVNVVNSVYKGVGYSTRVWGNVDAKGNVIGVYGDWLEKVRNLTSAGIAQGRDPVKIAKDLQVYIQGNTRVFGRWGKLAPGTEEYIRRIGKGGVDYRAVRLIDNELHNGLRKGAIENGDANPSCNGYDWILSPGRINWPCDCPQKAEGGPYTKENVPTSSHVKCACQVRERHVDRVEFTQMLKDYVNGVDSDGARRIDDWSRKYGLEVR